VSGRGRFLARLLPLLVALAVTGCGAATPGGPADSAQPNASPAASLDLDGIAVCDATVMMEKGLARVRAVKLRRAARSRLEGTLQSVLTGQDALLNRASYRMRTRLRTLGLAVTNLTLAVEDFRTTANIVVAATNVRRASKDLGKAIDSFQKWVGCGDIVIPTAPPDLSPDEESSPGPSIEG
jgi:hypothetical protein